MSAYVLVDIKIKDPATYEDYKTACPPSIASFGGKYLVRGGKTATLEGDWSPSRLVILEFPDIERAKAWWASTEYAPAKALRHMSASTQMVVVEGL